jgi:foldase protein PrsA
MRPIRLLLTPLAVAVLLVACGHDSPSVPASAIAVVGDRTILRSQFAALMAEARQSYEARGRPFPAAGTPAYEHLKRLAVSLLVEQAELEQEAPRLGVQVGEPEVEARLRQLKEQSFGGSDKRYRARLRAARMTDAQVRATLRAQLVGEAVRQAVTANVTVDAQAAQQYYEHHLAAYTTPHSRLVRHILVRTRALAQQLSRRLDAGASFAALARARSIDPRTRDEGGRLTLVEGRTAPSLDKVAFSLGTGRISRPFRTPFGWELVEALAPIEPGRTTPFARVRDGIRRRLLAQRRDQAFHRWLAKVQANFARRTAFADGFAPADGS